MENQVSSITPTIDRDDTTEVNRLAHGFKGVPFHFCPTCRIMKMIGCATRPSQTDWERCRIEARDLTPEGHCPSCSASIPGLW